MIDPSANPPPSPEPSAVEDTEEPRALTPEEQMERFEEDLKETDWGHQPC